MSEPLSYILLFWDEDSDISDVLPELSSLSDNFSMLYTLKVQLIEYIPSNEMTSCDLSIYTTAKTCTWNSLVNHFSGFHTAGLMEFGNI